MEYVIKFELMRLLDTFRMVVVYAYEYNVMLILGIAFIIPMVLYV